MIENSLSRQRRAVLDGIGMVRRSRGRNSQAKGTPSIKALRWAPGRSRKKKEGTKGKENRIWSEIGSDYVKPTSHVKEFIVILGEMERI
jgi:hypothetical protein